MSGLSGYGCRIEGLRFRKDKEYWEDELKTFSDSIIRANDNISWMEFKKSGTSCYIRMFNDGCDVVTEMTFESKDMMLGYVRGFNDVENFITK